MNIFNKLANVVKNPLWIIVFLNNRGFHILNDEKYIKLLYKLQFNRNINLNEPKTYNEKLQWLKLYDRKDIYTNMVDKYEVKKYVADIIGENYIIPTLGIFNKWEEIDFEKLPSQFVIKCTHYGGNKGVYIIKDKYKTNFNDIKIDISKILKKNLYYAGREWPYKNIKPRIIVEKYMVDKEYKDLKDFKIFCFNGSPKIILVCSNRNGNYKNTDFFDTEWNLMPFTRENHENNSNGIEKPKRLTEMLEIARKLSKDIPFVRVDLYEINGQVYFGELTFYPSAGFEGFNPPEYDRILGDMLELPKEKIVKK